MGKKRKEKQKKQKQKGVPKTRLPAKKKGNALSKWLMIAGILVLVYLIFLYSKHPFSKSPGENSNFLNDRNLDLPKERVAFPSPKGSPHPKEPRLGDFVGSNACAQCHQEQYELWRKSTHGLAGGLPNDKTVISPFNGNSLRFKDAVVTPVRKNGEYKFIIESENFPKQIFKVDAVVGGGHMKGGGTQSYFSKMPDGTLRFLPFDFIEQENLWFSQERNRGSWIPIDTNLSLLDLQQWPPARILGTNSNFSNCQNCHGSQVQVSYSLRQKYYSTEYRSLTINCESCHGPGKRHIQLAQSGKIETLKNVAMKSLSTLSKQQSLKTCLQCHATKDVIQEGYLPGKKLEHYYSLKFPMLAQSPYLEDGRVRAFAYQQNHLYSDCYLNGSMTCVDCHEPHSQKYRDINGKKLQNEFDNGQCTGCHASKAESPERHSHHKADSAGNLCTSCHMPYLQHQLVGTKLRFARADHTIPIPRPLYDDKIGIENACQKCHIEMTIAELEAKMTKWYGTLKPHDKMFQRVPEAQTIFDRIGASELLLTDSTNHEMAQFAALSHFVKKFLKPAMPILESEIVEKLMKLSESEDLDIKALALASLHFAYDHNSEVHAYLLKRLQDLESEEIPIRSRWAIAVDYFGTLYSSKRDFQNAIACYNKAVEIMPEDALALVNLGVAYLGIGNTRDAVNSFNKAIAAKPDYTSAYIQLGNLQQQLGDFSRAMMAYKRAIEIKPVDPSGHFFSARLYNLRGQKQKAIEALEIGLQYTPVDPNALMMLKKLRSH